MWEFHSLEGQIPGPDRQKNKYSGLPNRLITIYDNNNYMRASCNYCKM